MRMEQPEGQPQQSGFFNDIQPTGMSGGFKESNQDLLGKLFELKREIVIPLRFTLSGWTQDLKGKWVQPEDNYIPLMNEEGVLWAVQYVESYCNPAYLISNFNTDWLNYIMRNVSKDIIRTLCAKHKDFKLYSIHIRQVAHLIEHKVLAILLGALNDGYRRFLTESKQTTEVIQRTPDQAQSGLLSGLFKSRRVPI